MNNRVCTDPGKSWIVVEFTIQIFETGKVMELGLGPGKSWKINQMVATFLTVYVFCEILDSTFFKTPHFSVSTPHFVWTPHLN